MNFDLFPKVVTCCGATVLLAVMFVLIVRESWREVLKRGKGFAAVFVIGAVICTIHAQKSINLRVDNVTAKGFDCAWDYGELTPADFTDGETVKLTAQIGGHDYTYLIGTLPPTVTNYHVNAVLRGFPLDWMAHDVEVKARLNNANLTGGARIGDKGDGLPSINDVPSGGNE